MAYIVLLVIAGILACAQVTLVIVRLLLDLLRSLPVSLCLICCGIPTCLHKLCGHLHSYVSCLGDRVIITIWGS